MFDPSKMNLDIENENQKEIENESTTNNKVDIFDIKEDTLEKKETEEKEKGNESSIKYIKEVLEDSSGEKNIIEGEKNEIQKEKRIIFDININSIEYLIRYNINKEYDFFVIEPEDNKIKISFKKDNLEKEIKYIKYPVYSNIILKAKSITKLKVEETTISQEGSAEINLNKKVYKILSKTAPSNSGEKLFFKVVETQKKQKAKKKEKMSFGKMMSIFGGMLFTAILIGGVFISIVLFNSNSVSDLQFFNNLGVDTNAIKQFAANIVNATFGLILLTEIIFLFVFSYKVLLTKKEFKQKKVSRVIISIFFLILSVITFITWMFLAQKINSLKGLNYGKIEFYDNSKYLSELFEEQGSKININEKIIGPIDIRFNSKEFIQKLVDDGFSPEKVSWIIGKKEKEVAIEDYEMIHRFEEKGLTEVKLLVEGLNIKGEQDSIEKEIGKINIANIVKINEIELENGGSKFLFDASDLQQLGKVKWYYIPSLSGKTEIEINNIISKSLSKEKLEGYKFNSKNIFEGEEYYGIKVIKSGQKKKALDKIFIVSKLDKSQISGEIESKIDPNDSKKYEFKFKNPETQIGEAFIKEYIWTISDLDDKGEKKEITFNKEANLSDLEGSSKINYSFKKSGEHQIKLTIIDSEGKKQNFDKKIKIQKSLVIITKLKFKLGNSELEYKKDIIYEKENNTYYLENIPAPSSIEINANKIRTLNPRYGLKEVYYDLDDDGNFEIVGKKAKYEVNKEDISKFRVKYLFINKNITEEKIEIIETVHVTSINKEAILDLQIIKDSSYVPVIVKFDASGSKVTGKDIEKFIFDYGDNTPPEEIDSKNKGHKYIEAGNYNVTLRVITSDGKEYSITKKLILKNKPQEAVITTSFKKAPLYQEIDFSAENSTGEVGSYLWDFGDGKTSTKISPSHFYNKPGIYKVKLTLEFTNKNILEDEIEIEIYED